MTGPHQPDLGALFGALLATIREREEPILAEHDLSMWDYVILSALADTAAPTQARLAGITGRDKTRLIAHLDRLEAAGLLRRTPDPGDRRNRVVDLTPRGVKLWNRCRDRIGALEDDLLAAIPERRRAAWRRDLEAVAAARADTSPTT